MWKYITASTLKREFSSFVFFCWFVYDAYLTGRLPTTQLMPDAALTSWNGWGPYAFGLVTAAFGTDWISKQTTIAGPPMNTETSVKTETTDNSATVTTKSEPTP
jgi:hypothetical protein